MRLSALLIIDSYWIADVPHHMVTDPQGQFTLVTLAIHVGSESLKLPFYRRLCIVAPHRWV